ncbi:MAG TPA: ATPase domain-containing protein [Polyangiaceae bacterium]|nr:ATPase domain-containing protein [Polyangiaceae bacterium]
MTNAIMRLLSTGVPGLDTVLGGGLPEYSFNLVAGGPGAGKTTLAQQIAFARASAEAPSIYFTVLGEPPLKMLRHVQHYSFFDKTKIGGAVRFVNLSAEAMDHDLDGIMKRMLAEVEEVQPATVVVDSFRTVAHATSSDAQLQEFVQRLALHLTGWQATTFLVGEYDLDESHGNPLFTIADGIIWLTQSVERHACVRRMQVAKMRACATMPGLHTFSISADGIRVFPRILPRTEPRPRTGRGVRASTGVEALDAMMSGGIPAGALALFVGPSGSGKSTFARHFIAAGAQVGEPGVMVVVEEHPGEYLARASAFGPELARFIDRGLVEVLYLRSLDLTIDEALSAVRDAVQRKKARRVAIDSLSEFELALAPSYREDFRESLFRTISALTGFGVTALMTVDIVQSFTELGLSPHVTEFLADVLVLQRYVELEGKLEKVLSVVKMRTSRHDTSIRQYAIESSGVVVKGPVQGYGGALTGLPLLRAEGAVASPGLTVDPSAKGAPPAGGAKPKRGGRRVTRRR